MWLVLVILLILLLCGSFPYSGGYSANWGYGPFGIVGLLLFVLLILLILGMI